MGYQSTQRQPAQVHVPLPGNEGGKRRQANENRLAIPRRRRDEKKLGKHPTQKPLALIDRCLRASTNPGDLVVDPFAGSASTGVAALPIDRNFIGCDIEREYAELGSRRLAALVDHDSAVALLKSAGRDGQQRLLEVADIYHTSAD